MIVRRILFYTIVTIFITLIHSCSKKSELDNISQKHPFLTSHVNSLKNDTLVYVKCDECKLPGLDKNRIIGYTDRVRPTGNYYRKDLEIGSFEFDSFFVYEKSVYESNDAYKNIYKRVYFCHFNDKQKKKFNDFSHYYDNMISHGKQTLDIQFINNTAVIILQYAGY